MKVARTYDLIFVLLLGTTTGCDLPAAPLPEPQGGSSVQQFSLAANDIWRFPFLHVGTAKTEYVVDWTSATNDLDLFVLRGSFTNEELQGTVEFPNVIGESATASKPERLTVELGREDYTLVIRNNGPGDESVTLTSSRR